MDIFKSNIVVGIGAAVIATVMAPVILPVIVTAGRPLAKSLIKSGMMFYEKSREAIASAGEVMEDLIAEVRAEEAGRHAATAAVATPDSGSAPVPPMSAVRPHGGNGSEQNFGQHDTARIDPRAENGIAM